MIRNSHLVASIATSIFFMILASPDRSGAFG